MLKGGGIIKFYKEALWLREPFNRTMGFKLVVLIGKRWGIAIIKHRKLRGDGLRYKCPKCGAEYDYQPDYRECIECGTYLDLEW